MYSNSKTGNIRGTITRRAALALCMAATLASPTAFAQDYPSAPINLIIPVPPGGVLDVLGRGASEFFNRDLGQSFIIENVPGATGMLGAARVANSAPDGYTALLGVSAPFVTNSFLIKDMPIDPDRQFAPVIITTQSTLALVVHNSVPVTTLEEYIAYAKEHPKELTYASAGIGSPHHISGEYFASEAGIELTHIPYKSSTDATADVVGGHVNSAIVALGGILEQAAAGTVLVLAVTDEERSPLAPDVPTIGELLPGFVNAPKAWNGMFLPAGTPPEVVAAFNAEMNVALKDPEFSKQLQDLFLTPVGGAPEDVTTRIANERAVIQGLVDQLGIVPQ